MNPAHVKFRLTRIRLVSSALLLAGAAMAAPVDVSAELDRFTNKGKVPGMAVAVVHHGEIIATGASGVRKSGAPERVTIHDKFHVGSCTKSMTGSLAAMLVADGKISWKTKVAEVFPELEIHPDYREATLLQLLSNTGGVPGDVPAALWKTTVAHRADAESLQRNALVRALLAGPPAYPPGTDNVYSNGGFTIAGAMLEKVSGKSFEDLLQTRLFKPLEIQSAGLGTPQSGDKPEHPFGHISKFGKIVPIPPGPDADNPPAISPAGRVHLSILDFARYASFHLGTAKNPPVNAKTLDFLHTPVPPAKDYAIGWVCVERDWAGGKAITHNGSNTMSYAVIWLAPAKEFGVVAACNISTKTSMQACDEAVSLMIQRFLK